MYDIQDNDRFSVNLFVSDPFVTHNEVSVERDPKFARIKRKTHHDTITSGLGFSKWRQ